MKGNIISAIFFLLFIAVFNIIFFLLCGTDNLPSVWLSYGFIHFAYLTIVMLPLFQTKEASFYLTATLYPFSITYFILELITGIVFIVLKLDSLLWPLIIQLVLWFLFMLAIFGNAWANESTSQSLETRRQDMYKFQSNRMEIKKLLTYAKSPEIRKSILECYDRLDTSNSRQTAESQTIDMEISEHISSIKRNLMAGQEEQTLPLLNILKGLIEERKVTLKYINQ